VTTWPAAASGAASPALESALRGLRLTGMADMLTERLAQAGAGKLGHAELLALLVGDEQTRRDSAGLARRLAAAHFETTCAVEDFDFGYNPDIPAGIIRDLAGLAFLAAGQSVILHGPVGVGKTMLAQSLGQLACRRGHTVVFTKTSRLLADLAGGHADRSWATRLRRWARPALLICDDFAMRELTLPQADDLYEVITERAGRSMIVTSNRAPADWYPLFPNPVVAESIGGPVGQRRLPRAHARPQLPAQPATHQRRGRVAVSATRVSSPNETPGAGGCARPGCPQPVVRNAVGRPRLYCSPACRTEAYRQAHPASREPLIVEVDHGSTSSKGRPAGQVWLVRLRRGPHQAVLAIGLGKPSADYLASQIRDVIDPPPLATPARIR
jgi:DNA replication protein DnaC